jgi:cell division septum initiation protein DivIVA
MEGYLIKKEELKSEIEQREKEIAQMKETKKSVPRKIMYSELPENEKFDNVINQRKHFLDTIKLIAYRAETAMSNIIKQYMSHEDESRLLLKQIYKTDANIKVDKEKKKLVVEIHRLAYWKDDKILEKLCQTMNDTQMVFPNSNLTLFYKLVSS